ncbi:DUF6308 family protein [Brevibacterium sediminis]|uniref:Uncharacterized protein n=1 Tax=Brevibacterium sediminis TaxID=1857024 RepID=A0A5C4WZ07_9MICO|nr:DUF6308 family protein [Brevibacterium sediminis]TNM52885.1 hypothetical protein FHQ09_17370 [Brevibacterium sediminis]
MGIINAIHRVSDDEGADYLRKYYLSAEEFYTGSEFERIGADSGFENRFTAADLYSVTTLAVEVPARAGIAILGGESSAFNGLLEHFPNVAIGSLSESEFEEHLGLKSKAMGLWDLLRRNRPGDSRWGIGPTTTSKLMARKRPHLIPIEDSVVNWVIELGQGDSWRLWWDAFQAEGDYLEERATKLRAEIGRPELSTLRVFDVMLWMWGKANLSA